MQQYNGNAIKHLDAHCEKCVVIQMNQCYVHFVKRSYVKLLLSISCTEHNGCPEKTHSKLMEINVHVCTTELYVFAFPDQRVLHIMYILVHLLEGERRDSLVAFSHQFLLVTRCFSICLTSSR